MCSEYEPLALETSLELLQAVLLRLNVGLGLFNDFLHVNSFPAEGLLFLALFLFLILWLREDLLERLSEGGGNFPEAYLIEAINGVLEGPELLFAQILLLMVVHALHHLQLSGSGHRLFLETLLLQLFKELL